MGSLIFKMAFLFLFLTSCVPQEEAGLQTPDGVAATLGSSLNYVLPDITSTTSTMDLADDNGKPTILVFAQYNCSSCTAEADALAAALTDGMNPTKVNLITVMVSNTIDQARTFQAAHNVSWPIVLDSYSTLFNKLCPINIMRCHIIHEPGRGIIFSSQDAVTPAELQAISGAWY